MPNPIIYNPLLKKGFQELADTGSIEAEITQLQTDVTTLQSKKIDKCSTVDDVAALPVGTLFQWHGETNATFTFGYFYKQISQQITIPANSTFIKYASTYPTITENNYTFAPDNYYIIEDNTPLAGSSFFSYHFHYYTAKPTIVFLSTTYSREVGELCWDTQNYCYYTVTTVTTNSITLSNGETINTINGGGEPVHYLYKCENANGDIYHIIRGVGKYAVVHYQINGNTFTLIDWFLAPVYTSTTTNPVTIGADVYTQTNSQPNQLSVESNIVKYTLSDGINKINIAALPGTIENLLSGRLIAWDSFYKCLVTKTALSTTVLPPDIIAGDTFEGHTILSCCIYAEGGGYTFLYNCATQSNDGKLKLFGIRNGNSRDSVTLTDTVNTSNVWSGVGASMIFAYIVYI